MVFGFFILLTFSLQNLFANGFWNTYNRSWNSVKALYTERLLYSNVIRVNYDFYQESKHYKGTGILIDASLSDAIIFNDRFFKIEKENRIVNLTPVRSKQSMVYKEIYFTNLSFDSLQNLLKDKPVISLKLQTSLPLNFIQNNKPQSSTSVEMDYVFNPVFSSQNIDSTDKQTEKELFDALQELSTKKELYNAKLQEIEQKKAENKAIQSEYNKALQDLDSRDLSEKEMAMKSAQKLKSAYENSLTNLRIIPENFTALNNKIAFLKSKIHIVKTQSINGYLKYIQIN